MKKAPMLHTVEYIMRKAVNETQAQINGRWVPARPLGLYNIKNRLRLACMVFIGKYDALEWPEGQ